LRLCRARPLLYLRDVAGSIETGKSADFIEAARARAQPLAVRTAQRDAK
jgi:hypothetical protein